MDDIHLVHCYNSTALQPKNNLNSNNGSIGDSDGKTALTTKAWILTPTDSSADSSYAQCKQEYIQNVVKKLQFIFPKLRRFIEHGNDAHAKYLRDDAVHNICRVPLAKDVKPLRFGDMKCADCSLPDF